MRKAKKERREIKVSYFLNEEEYKLIDKLAELEDRTIAQEIRHIIKMYGSRNFKLRDYLLTNTKRDNK